MVQKLNTFSNRPTLESNQSHPRKSRPCSRQNKFLVENQLPGHLGSPHSTHSCPVRPTFLGKVHNPLGALLQHLAQAARHKGVLETPSVAPVFKRASLLVKQQILQNEDYLEVLTSLQLIAFPRIGKVQELRIIIEDYWLMQCKSRSQKTPYSTPSSWTKNPNPKLAGGRHDGCPALS